MQSAVARPLFTLLILTYRQEDFVREAVEAALAQTYQPLEVLISDDDSPDRTFDIVQELCASYRGPHSVVINRNEQNMGIGAHIQKMHRLARGEWIVHAAGDDISRSDRVERIADAIGRHQRAPSMVVSNATRIYENGEAFGTLVDPAKQQTFSRSGDPLENPIPMLGCTVAIHSSLVSDFPSMMPGLMAEDVVLYRRAHMRNGLLYLPDQLVAYRQHRGAVSQQIGKSSTSYIATQLKWTRDRLLRLEQLRLDAAHIGYPDAGALALKIEQYRRSEERVFRVLGDSPFAAFGAVVADLLHGPRKAARIKLRLKDFAVRWMPWVLGYK